MSIFNYEYLKVKPNLDLAKSHSMDADKEVEKLYDGRNRHDFPIFQPKNYHSNSGRLDLNKMAYEPWSFLTEQILYSSAEDTDEYKLKNLILVQNTGLIEQGMISALHEIQRRTRASSFRFQLLFATVDAELLEAIRCNKKIESTYGIKPLVGLDQIMHSLRDDLDLGNFYTLKDTIIHIGTSANNTTYQLMLQTLPTLFPDAFKLTEDTTEILKSIVTAEQKTYTEKGNIFLNKLHLTNTKETLYSLTLARSKARKEISINNISRFKSDLQNAERNHRDIITTLNRENAKLKEIIQTLETKTDPKFDDLMNFLGVLKSLEYFETNMDEGTFILEFRTPISLFSKTAAENILNQLEHVKDIHTLFKLIFIDEKYKLNFSARYSIDINSYNIEYISKLSTASERYSMPNTHMQSYQCFGSHLDSLSQYRENQDLIGAISKLIDVTANMNFTDSIVTDKFIYELKQIPNEKANLRMFSDKNNTPMSYIEIMKSESEQI